MLQLDDWVLCQVRQKNSIPRSTWEDQNVPSSAPTGFFPGVNDLLDTNINPNIEMIRNYFYNDCPMLTYIFSSQDFPSTERVSSINFPSTDKSSTSLGNLLNSLKRKHVERDQQRENCFPRSKKLRTKADMEEEGVLSIRNDGTDENLCGMPVSLRVAVSVLFNGILSYSIRSLIT
jgi:hypothetical protein